MNIDFRKFDYRILAFRAERPATLNEPLFQENSIIDFKFSNLKSDKGLGLTIKSLIKISDHQDKKVLLFKMETDFLIPDEQPAYLLQDPDRLTEITKAVYLELLYFHLSRQTTLIFAETNRYSVKLPNMLTLYQTIDLLQ